jgi:hypothetical protein
VQAQYSELGPSFPTTIEWSMTTTEKTPSGGFTQLALGSIFAGPVCLPSVRIETPDSKSSGERLGQRFPSASWVFGCPDP